MANDIKHAKINSRLIQKHDTAENWGKATNFIPLKGELIIYDDTNQIKIGDGITTVVNLPFYDPRTKRFDTAGQSSVAATQSPSHGQSFHIPSFKYDEYGNITEVGTTSVTLPGISADQDTTYTFEDGTEQFEVTPKDGSKQIVKVTPAQLHDTAGQTSIPATQAPSHGQAFNIPSVSYDVHGRITGVGTTSVTLPSLPTDQNTTYTFSDGTNGFTVKPSNSDSQFVNVTPEININVTEDGTGPIVGSISQGTNKNSIVAHKVSLASLNISSPLRFKSSTTWAGLKAITAAEVGDVYNITDKDSTGNTGQNWACIKKVTTACTDQTVTEYWDALGGTVDLSNYVTLNGTETITGAKTFKAANIFKDSINTFEKQIRSTVANGTAPFDITSTTLVTNLNADKLDGQDGSYYLNAANLTGTGNLPITIMPTSGVTAGTYGAAATPSHGGTFNIPSLTVDKYGRVTGAQMVSITLPTDNNTDTKVAQTAVSSAAWRKVLLSYGSNSATDASMAAATNEVYAANEVEVQPSTGVIKTEGYNVSGKVTMQYDSAKKSLKFVF